MAPMYLCNLKTFLQNLDNFLHNSFGIKIRSYKHKAWLGQNSVREKDGRLKLSMSTVRELVRYAELSNTVRYGTVQYGW